MGRDAPGCPPTTRPSQPSSLPASWPSPSRSHPSFRKSFIKENLRRMGRSFVYLVSRLEGGGLFTERPLSKILGQAMWARGDSEIKSGELVLARILENGPKVYKFYCLVEKTHWLHARNTILASRNVWCPARNPGRDCGHTS